MSALAEALLAAQRQALGALEKAYVAGKVEWPEVVDKMQACGCTDVIEADQLCSALDVLREYGAAAPATMGNGKPDPATEPASEAQMKYLHDLADRSGKIAPDWKLTKAQASTVIEQLKAGTYNADEWTAPF